jgi:lipopolysaccharide transport system ATP-binding protein
LERGARISEPKIFTLAGEQVNNLIRRETYIYAYEVEFIESFTNVRFGMLIKTVSGFELGGRVNAPVGRGIPFVPGGVKILVNWKFECLLAPGVYFLNAGVVAMLDEAEGFLHRRVDAAAFRVLNEESLTLSGGPVDFTVTPEIFVLDASTSAKGGRV